MLWPIVLVTVGLIGHIVAGYGNGFNVNQYPQAQVNAWSQACRSFQAQALATQAQQNQFFSNMFPQIQLPPLPFTDLCSQAAFTGAGAGASAGSFSHGAAAGVGGFDNRFGGNDAGYGGGGGVQGVSVSSSLNGHGQGGTTVTQFGHGGSSSTNYIPHGANQHGGYQQGGYQHGGGYGGQGVSISSFGSNGGGAGFATANRFGGSSGNHGGSSTHYVSNGGSSVSSYGPNGGSFASASRFGGSNGGGASGYGGSVGYGGGGHGVAVGSSVSSTSHGNGGGSVQTSVYKQHF